LPLHALPLGKLAVCQQPPGEVVTVMIPSNTFTLRPYQREASEASVRFLTSHSRKHGLLVLPTGSGKSLVIADIVEKLQAPTLVFQPSREILKQNFAKLMKYGFRPAVYSASLGRKQISLAVTLATIGSVAKNASDFDHVKYIIIDECHGVNAKSGMYAAFFQQLESQGIRILGLTATPYRLVSTMDGPILKFLTRTRPRVFDELVYYVQNGQLFRDGHLAKLQYFPIKGFDRSKLQANSTGADYTDKSVQLHFRELGFSGKLQRVVERLVEIKRRGVLVFTRFVEESKYLVDRIPGAAMVSAETADAERDRILKEFQAGTIRVVCNVGVLTTGFDYPELDTVVLARPTMSLALFYQMVGRCVRPHPNKVYGMVVDMVGLTEQFGRVEDLRIETGPNKLHYVASGGRQLTNIVFNGRGR
jgi:DNA repair protein RadD